MSTYAGSADNGAIDMEYTPQPERKICAADEHFATRDEVQALANDLCADIDALAERLATADQHYATREQLKQLAADHEKELDELSRSVHALTWLVERLLKTPEDQSYVATEPPPARLVIDADSVPWDALRTVLMDIDATSVEYDVIDNFVLANAPKEPTE